MTVTFNSSGGSAPNPSSKAFTYGSLPSVSKAGFKFDGWFTAATGGTKVESTTQVTNGSNHTLFAHWTAISITLTFNANGGGAPSPASKAVTNGSAYGTLPAVSKTGFRFDGWFTAATGGTKVEQATKVTNAGNHTLYAHWTAVSAPVPPLNPSNKTISIGDIGPGGGIVFSIEGGRFLECSSGEIGSKVTWNEAVQAVRNFRGGGKTDWRLPTKDEMDKLYNNLHIRKQGGFKFNSTDAYWSSSEFYAFCFGNGVDVTAASRAVQFWVRAVRNC